MSSLSPHDFHQHTHIVIAPPPRVPPDFHAPRTSRDVRLAARRRRSAPPDRVPARALARCDGREVGGCGGVRRVVGGMRGGRCGWAASPSCQRARHRDMRLAHADTSAESGSDMSSGAPTHHRHTLRIVVTGSYCAPDRRIMAASASRRAHLRELTSCANMWCVRGRGQQHLRTRW